MPNTILLDTVVHDNTSGNSYRAKAIQEDGNVNIYIDTEQESISVGYCLYEFRESSLYINLMGKCYENYTYVGTAIHEAMFRISIDNPISMGRVKLNANWGAEFFHFKLGFRTYINSGFMGRFDNKQLGEAFLRLMQLISQANTVEAVAQLEKLLGSYLDFLQQSESYTKHIAKQVEIDRASGFTAKKLLDAESASDNVSIQKKLDQMQVREPQVDNGIYKMFLPINKIREKCGQYSLEMPDLILGDDDASYHAYENELLEYMSATSYLFLHEITSILMLSLYIEQLNEILSKAEKSNSNNGDKEPDESVSLSLAN